MVLFIWCWKFHYLSDFVKFGAVGAVQVQLVQFIRHRRFPYLSWVWCSRCSSGAVQVQFKKAKILNWRRRFLCLSWVWCSWCSWCSKFFKPININFWFLKIWNLTYFCQILCIVKNHSLTHDISLYVVFFLHKSHFYQFCVLATMYLYDTIFNYTH